MEVFHQALFLVLLFFGLGFAAMASAQDNTQAGFISIDCGAPESYTDENTGINYISDEGLIETGEVIDISSSYVPPGNLLEVRQYQNLRSFPSGTRNCYILRPALGKFNKYLIRTTFFYSNYDDKVDDFPQFDIHLGADYWETIRTSKASFQYREIIHIPSSDNIYVCLVNTGNGTPFISSLELRPLNISMYQTSSFKGSLTTIGFGHFDIGNNNSLKVSSITRYKDDIYDRLWTPVGCLAVGPQLTSINTTSHVDVEKSSYKPPSVVMATACTAEDSNNNSLTAWIPKEYLSDHLYFVLHFAQLQPNRIGQGQFRIFVNGEFWGVVSIPSYLTPTTIFVELPLSVHNGRGYLFSINATENSTVTPIINAIEAFKAVNILQSQTSDQETAAMFSIKTSYNISRNWQGDPCAPQNLVWDGLKCSYNGYDPPIIISLNLSSSGITRTVSAAISNLTMLQTLDLSQNGLTGLLPDFLGKLTSLRNLDLSSSGITGDVPVTISNLTLLQSLNLSHNSLSGQLPDFLGKLTSLRTLNLEGNNFTGPIPSILLEKWNKGVLSLSIEGLPEKESSHGSKWKGKKVMIAVVILLGVLVVLALALLAVLRRKKKNQGKQLPIAETSKEKDQNRYTLEPKHKEFTYSEIVNITKNFQKELGRGSYGIVYHGLISEDTEVAVKMYSSSSFDEGFKELQLEANVLMSVHHRNLTSLIGYCIDGTRVGIIYEYMANGDLRRHLSEKSLRVLSWQERMQIAVDVAQGLEYMHYGCKPPIVHRDVKSSNILLDQNFKAKIADFGLCKPFPNESATHVSTEKVAGTKWYLDPAYAESGRINQRSDVYSFGIVLLEIITSKPAIDLIQWVSRVLERGDVKEAVDPRLMGDFDIPSANKAVQVATICASHDPTQRPTMNKVVVELRQCLSMEMTRREMLSNKSVHGSQETEVSLMSTEVLYVGR